MINSAEIPILVLLFLFGASIGSFLNVVIYRVPRGINIISPSSHCFSCKEPIKFYHNIPLISYLISYGSCKYCGESFSVRYLLVELLTAILTVLIYLIYGFNVDFFPYLILIFLLIPVTFIDIDHLIIPNGFIILGLTLIPVFLFLGWLKLDIADSVYGALTFSIFLFTLGIIGKFILKKEAMGFGDVKLGLVLGGFLGLKTTILALYISFIVAGVVSSIGLITKWVDRKNPIPFGPYLAFGTLISILTHASPDKNLIMNWYFSL